MPPNRRGGGHIVFGADPVGFGVASALYLPYQRVEFDQTCTDILLGRGKDVIRFLVTSASFSRPH